MGKMSELYHDLEIAKALEGPQDIEAAMAVRDLMSATQSLSALAAAQSTARLVQVEANDIELAYTRLGRMLSHIRAGQV